MYYLLTKDVIIEFLNYFGIDFNILSIGEQSQVVFLAHIYFILFWFIVAYILYRVFIRIFG